MGSINEAKKAPVENIANAIDTLDTLIASKKSNPMKCNYNSCYRKS